MRSSFLRPVLLAAVAVPVSLGLLSSTASAATTLSKLSPSSGPELASTAVTIHGKGFSSAPGGTTVSFGGESALSVTCSSASKCVATTPDDLFEGPVAVTVTSGASTSAPQTFTFTTFSPPVIDINTSMKGQAQFNRKKMHDYYPAIFDPGNIYLEITNTTAATQTVTGNFALATFTLGPGETEGLNMPASPTPYTFTVEGSTSPKATLTVATVK